MIHKILYRNTELIDMDLLFYNCFIFDMLDWSVYSLLWRTAFQKHTEKREICFFFTNTNKILSIPQIILLTHLHANMIGNDSSIHS